MVDLPEPVNQTIQQLLDRVQGGMPEQLMLRDFIVSSMGRLGSISSELFGTVPNSPIVEVNTIALQRAIDFSSLYNIPIFIPAGTYLIDGYKGPFSSWNATHGGGLWLKAGARLWGSGKHSTIIKNAADNWRMVIGIKSGYVELKHLTIDGDIQNHPNIILGDPTSALVDDKRGEGIIFWGGGTVSFEIEDVEVKNTGHYGIGVQNVLVLDGSIINTSYEWIGGDCCDIKSFSSPSYLKPIIIRGFRTKDGCGHNYPGGGGVSPHTNQACLDLRGECIASDIYIEGLDSFGTSLGANGVRVSPPVNSENRLGGKGSIVKGVKVKSSKLANEGSGTQKRIIGIAITDSDISLSDYIVENCFWGVRVFDSGDGTPVGVNITNGSALKCTGAGSDAVGLAVSNACSQVNVANHRSKGCEVGVDLAGTLGTYSGITLADNTVVGLDASDDFFETNVIQGFQFSNNASDLTSSLVELVPRSGVFKRGLAVIKDRGGLYSVISTHNGSDWTGADAVVGGYQVVRGDDSGPGDGVCGQILVEMTNTDGSGGTRIKLRPQSPSALVDALILSSNVVAAQLPITKPMVLVSELPDPTTMPNAEMYVSDSTVTYAAGLGNVVAGGGANRVPVNSDGTDWRIG